MPHRIRVLDLVLLYALLIKLLWQPVAASGFELCRPESVLLFQQFSVKTRVLINPGGMMHSYSRSTYPGGQQVPAGQGQWKITVKVIYTGDLVTKRKGEIKQ